MIRVRSITDAGSFHGQRALVRLDLNVPVRGDIVLDDFRVRKSIPTLRVLSEGGAKIIAVSHEGREEGTLRPAYEILTRYFPRTIFTRDFRHPVAALQLGGLRGGDIILFENLRDDPGEEANSPAFARSLADLADFYVNDAFSASHRAHASIVGVPALLPSYAGLQMIDEITHLSRAFDPPRPFLFIMGGAKFETKLPLIRKFLPRADAVFVGGALANDLFRERGYDIGDSCVSDGVEGLDLHGVVEHKNLMLPVDVRVSRARGDSVKAPDTLVTGERIVDAGPETLALLAKKARDAAFILWNGPLGAYEDGCAEGTEELAHIIARSEARSVVGGGDTLAAITHLKLENDFSFVSTGGGAMLQFLAEETLPGIEALKNRE